MRKGFIYKSTTIVIHKPSPPPPPPPLPPLPLMALYSLRVRRTLTTLSSFIHHHRSLPPISASSSSYSSPLLQSLIYSPSPSPTLPVQSRLFKTSSISLSSAISYNNSDDGDDDNISSHTIFFEGCDYNHWLFMMDFPKSLKLTPEQMVETYVQTCAKGLNISVEEAKKKMYACSTTTYTGFQAVMTEEESEKFRGLPGVLFILPDCYIDQTSQEYGGDKYINGTIIPRPPPFNYGSIWGRPKFLRSGAKELYTCGADRDGASEQKLFLRKKT
ncbi:hypothetical protein L1049_023869 [Liquidambar formosana]|uniref:MORF/ORRM1/DAG-like MORF domain-containing protein n=1 Tax=Liquidambar formosana TaxID=63359 RepID=A0AAP0X3Y0_LIQFO